MDPSYILIVGSASERCDAHNLARAKRFARASAREIIETGNGVSVLATKEPLGLVGGKQTSLTFDWDVLRAIGDYLDERPPGSVNHKVARVFTGDESATKRISLENLGLLQRLQAQQAIEVIYIDENLYSGGEYRAYQEEDSHGAIAIGGGKGTYILGSNFLEAGLPVFPVDIRIGARHNDGNGALQLLTEMKDKPERFLPCNNSIVAENLLALSLDSPLWEIERVAYVIARVLADEMIHRSESDRLDANVKRGVVDKENDSEPPPKSGISGKAVGALSKVPIVAQTAHHATKVPTSIQDLFSMAVNGQS